jgi:hypothetical protein
MSNIIKENHFDFYLHSEKNELVIYRDIHIGNKASLMDLISNEYCAIYYEGQKIVFPTKRIFEVKQTIISSE